MPAVVASTGEVETGGPWGSLSRLTGKLQNEEKLWTPFLRMTLRAVLCMYVYTVNKNSRKEPGWLECQ